MSTIPAPTPTPDDADADDGLTPGAATISFSAKKRAFLAALATTGNISRAAAAAGVHRMTHYDWLEQDADGSYAAAVAAAEAEAADLLEAEARRRALEGWDEAVYWRGREVGATRKYSDTLLIFLLKGARPEKYRENSGGSSIAINNASGGPLQVNFNL